MPGVLQMASILRPEVPDFRVPLTPILSVEVEKPNLEVAALLPLLQRCDVAFFSSDFMRGRASDLLGEEAATASAPGQSNQNWRAHLAVKCLQALAAKANCRQALWICPWGAFGAFALELPDGEVYFERALVVKAVDSLGAGDTFVAASLCALGNGADPQQALRCACAVAGKKVPCA
ncbi:KHK [Symbiodinium pilosum]|uniref:KHK protein n=1 Tax=Symbiodinium pilosum TaxID=2952 RepID=A0A812WMS8_SYMPI|nr:KHK [Symbiodinium pilosum]